MALAVTPLIDTELSDFLSPDGRWLAYPANPSGRWEIFLQPHPAGRARRLSTGPGAKLGLRWFPDSFTLAYLRDETGSEDYSLYIQPLPVPRSPAGDAPARKIETGFPVEPNFAISPSGQIACFESGTGKLYILPNLLTDLGCPGRSLTFSPDGRYLAAVAETGGQDTGIFLISMETGQIILDKTPPAQDPVFSPDSATLAFSVSVGERSTLTLYSLSTGKFTPLDILSNIDLTQPAFSPDGRSLVCVASNGPESILLLCHCERAFPSERSNLRLNGETASTGDCRAAITRWLAVTPAPGVCSHPTFTPDGESVIFAFENAKHPPALWRYTVKTGLMKPLPPFSNPENGGRRGKGVEHITYPSLNGLPVPALLYRPTNPTGAAVVYIHGGPNWLSQNHWDEHINDFLERGWTVLAPNYRGSTGYGRSWQLANRFDPGGGDCDDILAGADFLIREQLASPEKIAVTGRSYGGYLTLMALIRAPEKWCAGSAVAPFFSFFASEHIRPDVLRWDIENFGDPRQRPEFFRERSPQFHLEMIQAPLQLISGGNDFRCPAAESSAARDELARLEKPVELCLYPDEGHVFLKSKNMLDARQKRLDFLAKHLIQE
jgi:dipeptidyl aminopeptidase/acylaminoacyl peptidase